MFRKKARTNMSFSGIGTLKMQVSTPDATASFETHWSNDNIHYYDCLTNENFTTQLLKFKASSILKFASDGSSIMIREHIVFQHVI